MKDNSDKEVLVEAVTRYPIAHSTTTSGVLLFYWRRGGGCGGLSVGVVGVIAYLGSPCFPPQWTPVTCALCRVPGSSRSLLVLPSRDVCLLVARLTRGRRSCLRPLAFCLIDFVVFFISVPVASPTWFECINCRLFTYDLTCIFALVLPERRFYHSARCEDRQPYRAHSPRFACVRRDSPSSHYQCVRTVIPIQRA